MVHILKAGDPALDIGRFRQSEKRIILIYLLLFPMEG